MIKNYCNSTVAAILYLVIPIIIFFITWLHWYVGIPASILLIYASFRFIDDNFKKNKDLPRFSKTKEAFFASVYILLYLLITGHGTFIGSAGYDTPWRNAIYQDLVVQSWPVIYEYSQSALIYYLTYWLVPAGLSSIFCFDESSSNAILFVWTFIGIRIFVSLLWNYLHLKNTQIIPITFFFLFWSGLNVLGELIVSSLNFFPFEIDIKWGWYSWWYTGLTIDGYQMTYMIRTVFDSLGNTYNQFGPTLLGTILFLQYRQVKYLALIGLLVVPYSPIGFIGLFLLMIAEVMKKGIIAIKMRRILFLQELFSITNIIPSCTIFPIFLFYFIANAVNSTNNDGYGAAQSIFSAPLSAYGLVRIMVLLLYYLFQFGIFLRLCYKNNNDKFLLWSVLLSLVIFPIFRVGESGDFCWNASVPGFYITMVFMMQEILRLFKNTMDVKHFFVVSIVVTLACLTPCMQIASSFRKCAYNRTTLVNIDHADVGGTYSNKSRDEMRAKYRNFANVDYNNQIFYVYLAKKT